MRAIRLIVCGLVALTLCSGAVLAAADGDPTVGSLDGAPHDLRTLLGIQELCKPCHVPHHAPYYLDGPLWNHQPSALPGLTGSSKLCMGCHDGVTAVDSYGGTTGTILPAALDRWNIGHNGLADDHPVSIDYPTDSHILEPVTTVESYLEDGKVECGSCHRAHGFGSDTLTDPPRYILRKTRAGSQICRVCHTF